MHIRLLLIALYSLFMGFGNLQATEPITLTIYVHGSQPPILKHSRFFYRKKGLQPLNAYQEKHHKRTTATIAAQLLGGQKDLQNTYIFGWSGKLSAYKRDKAAGKLLQALQKLLQRYADNDITNLKLRIITHSHGGNVVLRLANLVNDQQLQIDELIILACPIVPETAGLHTSPVFKKIYAFYAANDLFQIADKPAHAHGRYFSPSENLVQACVKIEKSVLWRLATHFSFTSDTFLQHLPALCAQADEWYATMDPEHHLLPPTITIKHHGHESCLVTRGCLQCTVEPA